MSTPLVQHQREMERNRAAWQARPLLRAVYASFYERLVRLVDPHVPGPVVELGSGLGALKAHLPHALCTDLFPNPWLDLVCDAYELPFRDGTISHLVLLDVFHHLRAPNAFLREARRALHPAGRLLLCEPYLSWCSWPAYAWAHHEPVAWRRPIDLGDTPPRPRHYYAAQGNATRLFFRREIPGWPPGWELLHAEAFSSFSYLLARGYSKPALYPARWLPALQRLDRWLSRWPRLCGARCVVALRPRPAAGASGRAAVRLSRLGLVSSFGFRPSDFAPGPVPAGLQEIETRLPASGGVGVRWAGEGPSVLFGMQRSTGLV